VDYVRRSVKGNGRSTTRGGRAGRNTVKKEGDGRKKRRNRVNTDEKNPPKKTTAIKKKTATNNVLEGPDNFRNAIGGSWGQRRGEKK